MGAGEAALDHHRIVGVMGLFDRVVEVRKGGLVLQHQLADARGAVIGLGRSANLVAGMGKGRDCAIEDMRILVGNAVEAGNWPRTWLSADIGEGVHHPSFTRHRGAAADGLGTWTVLGSARL